MFKLFFFTALMFCFNLAFASLNESDKPSEINIYLEQESPYSFFDEKNKAQGLLIDYWLNWSVQSAIPVNFYLYEKNSLPRFLTDNKNNIYSGLTLPTELADKTVKSSLVKINTHFYYPFNNSLKVKSSLADQNSSIQTGGLLAQAQLLPVFRSSPNIHYKQYSGLFELLFAVYRNKIDAVVFFTGENERLGFLDSFLSTLFTKNVTNNSADQLVVYSLFAAGNLVAWLQWGEVLRLESTSGQMVEALQKQSNAWWGLSSDMAENFVIIICCFLLLILFIRIKRRSDKQFENIFYSSPYPLVIFSLDGSIIYYLNEQAEFLFPFKSYKNRYKFRHVENQVVVSKIINQLSHQMSVEDEKLRLKLDNGKFQYIALTGKRVHYKHHSVWLCYLKDITEILQIEERKEALKQTENILQATEKTLTETEEKLVASENSLFDAENKLSSTEIKLILIEDNLTELEIKNSATELILSSVESDLIEKNGLLTKSDNKLTETDKQLMHLTANLVKIEESLKLKKQQEKKTKKTLGKQELLLNTLFSVTADPIALFDCKNKLIAENCAFSQLMACRPQEILKHLQETNSLQEALIFEENLFYAGKEVFYEICKTPFNSPENEVQGFVLMARDITVHKQMEEQLTLPVSKPLYALAIEKAEIKEFSSLKKYAEAEACKALTAETKYFLNGASSALADAIKQGGGQICVYKQVSNI